MMELNWNSKQCIVFVFLISAFQDAFSVDWHTVSACYGITHENFMTLECEADTVIALKDVRAMVKLSTTNCPQEETAIAPADESCCRRQAEDCGATYTGVVASQYYTLCHGRSSCKMLQPTWVDTDIDTDCDISKYLPRTNYMEMEYQCISTQSGASPCASTSVTDTSVILWNDGYPNRMQPKQDGCTCSLETPCDTPIQITAFDVRFKGGENGGVCKQGITITENGQTTKIGCESNNDFQQSIIYTSSSGFLIIKLQNDFPTYGGQFWFEIIGISDNTSVTLSCGELTQLVQSPQNAKCTTTSTTPPTTLVITSPSTTPLQSNTTDVGNETSTDQSTTPETTLNITTTLAERLNDTVDDDSINGTRPANDSSDEDNLGKGENDTKIDDGTTDNSTMSVNDTQHTNESIMTTSSIPTTVEPNLDFNTTLTYLNGSSISTEGSYLNRTSVDPNKYYNTTLTYINGSSISTDGYNLSTTSVDPNMSSTSISTTVDNQTNTYNTGDGSQGSTVKPTGVSDGGTSTGSGVTNSGQNGGVSQGGKGSGEGPNTTSGAAESGDGMMMIIIIAAVIVALLVILLILLFLCRKKIKELLCGEKAKSQVDAEEYRSESPPKYDTMPDYLFPTSDSPVISSAPAGSTQLLFRKHLEKDIFDSGFAGRKQQLQPILSKIPTEKRLPPVDTSFHTKPKKTQKPQKLGFLNMIMVENQKNPLPRLLPDHEGAIKESYGASSHATTDREVIEKGKENVKKKKKVRRKKKRLMDRIHVHSTATHLNPY